MTHEERQRAALAALNNEAVMAAIEALRSDAISVWAATDLSETQEREIAYFQLLGITQVKAQLEIWSRDTKGKGDK